MSNGAEAMVTVSDTGTAPVSPVLGAFGNSSIAGQGATGLDFLQLLMSQISSSIVDGTSGPTTLPFEIPQTGEGVAAFDMSALLSNSESGEFEAAFEELSLADLMAKDEFPIPSLPDQGGDFMKEMLVASGLFSGENGGFKQMNPDALEQLQDFFAERPELGFGDLNDLSQRLESFAMDPTMQSDFSKEGSAFFDMRNQMDLGQPSDASSADIFQDLKGVMNSIPNMDGKQAELADSDLAVGANNNNDMLEMMLANGATKDVEEVKEFFWENNSNPFAYQESMVLSKNLEGGGIEESIEQQAAILQQFDLERDSRGLRNEAVIDRDNNATTMLNVDADGIEETDDNMSSSDFARDNTNKNSFSVEQQVEASAEADKGDKTTNAEESFMKRVKQMEEAQSVARQLAQSASFKQGVNGSEFTIKLEPDYLGRLKINISQDSEGDGMIAKIVAESSYTKEVLNNNLPTLKDSLSAEGIEIDDIQILNEDEDGSDFNNLAEGDANFSDQAKQSEQADQSIFGNFQNYLKLDLEQQVSEQVADTVGARVADNQLSTISFLV